MKSPSGSSVADSPTKFGRPTESNPRPAAGRSEPHLGGGAGDHAGARLAEQIVSRSLADNWHDARTEWVLDHVFVLDADEPGQCLCGRAPIRECCVLVNRLNGAAVVVGNVCVTRFLGLPAEAIFAGLRRIAGDPARAMSAALIEHARRHRWIDGWEDRFLRNTARERRLSPRQRAMRERINRQVLAAARAAGVGEEVARA